MSPPLGPGPSARCCHYCGHDRVHRWGTFAGRQRYRCVRCLRTYSTFTGTPLYYLKRIDCWRAFCQDMDQVRTIRFTSGRLGLDKDTVFRWRHRVLATVEALPQPRFKGLTAVGDAAFRYNHKGRPRDLAPSPDRQTGPAMPRPDHVWVLIALNGEAGRRFALFDGQRIGSRDVVSALQAHVSPDCVLIGGRGMYSPISVAARQLRVQYRTPAPGKSAPTDAGFLPAYVRRLRSWLARFRGVATHYLTRYMSWFHALDTGPGLTRWSLMLSLKGTGQR